MRYRTLLRSLLIIVLVAETLSAQPPTGGQPAQGKRRDFRGGPPHEQSSGLEKPPMAKDDCERRISLRSMRHARVNGMPTFRPPMGA